AQVAQDRASGASTTAQGAQQHRRQLAALLLTEALGRRGHAVAERARVHAAQGIAERAEHVLLRRRLKPRADVAGRLLVRQVVDLRGGEALYDGVEHPLFLLITAPAPSRRGALACPLPLATASSKTARSIPSRVSRSAGSGHGQRRGC